MKEPTAVRLGLVGRNAHVYWAIANSRFYDNCVSPRRYTIDRQILSVKRERKVAIVERNTINTAIQSAAGGRVLGQLLGALRASQPVIGHLETLT